MNGAVPKLHWDGASSSRSFRCLHPVAIHIAKITLRTANAHSVAITSTVGEGFFTLLQLPLTRGVSTGSLRLQDDQIKSLIEMIVLTKLQWGRGHCSWKDLLNTTSKPIHFNPPLLGLFLRSILAPNIYGASGGRLVDNL
jgi:hypothetical protein